MEIATLKSNPSCLLEYKSVDYSLSEFDLPSLVENMRHSYSWVKGELKSMVLLKSPIKNIILTAMHEGTEIMSFQSNDSITFQVIEGTLEIHVNKDILSLQKDHSMTIDKNVKYRLTSRGETVFLLTINDTLARPSNN
jgi:hypothetical protein